MNSALPRIIAIAAQHIARIFFVSLILAGTISGQASAQIIDDIILRSANGKIVVTIRMADPVQFLSHFPATKGQTLEIYFNVLRRNTAPDSWQGYEARTSPPSDLIPGFWVTARDMNTRPKLVVRFDRVLEFDVQSGKNNQTILIIISPKNLPPGMKDGLPELPEVESGVPESESLPQPAASTTPEKTDSKVARQAAELMIAGRDALLLFNYTSAVESFGKVLQLPANKYTADALEWTGVSNENAGLKDAAKKAYSQYLERYPGSIGADRVSRRLAGLTTPAVIAEQNAQSSSHEVPAAESLPAQASPFVTATPQHPAVVTVAAPTVQEIPGAASLPPSTHSVSAASVVPATGSVAQQTSGKVTATESASIPVVHAVPAPSVSSAAQFGQVPEIDRHASALMAAGKDALQKNDFGLAINSFNRLLQLPPNEYTQDAQELVGVAREQVGQKFKAKLEYELYLKTYPDGPGAARVKERLAKLSTAQPLQSAGRLEQPREKQGFQSITYGSMSMYYYHGASQTDTVTTNGNLQTPASLTIVDQSLLLTNINLGMRTHSDEYDDRLVFQDTFSKNFLAGRANDNRISAAYLDVKNKVNNYSARMGRQSPTGGGVTGRFDGVVAGYGFQPKWRINGMAGQLSDSQAGSKPVFYGASLDMGTFNEHWGSSVYFNKQTTDGITDRNAEGAEMRYFDSGNNAFATLDYDSYFSVVNTVMVQGTLTASPETTYNFLLDHRRTPSISSKNALNGATASSINALLLAGFSASDVKELAKARTAIANLAQIGVSRQLVEKWQLGGDIKVSNTTALASSGRDPANPVLCPLGTVSCPEGFQPAVAGTGNQWTLTSQLIGTSIFSHQDISVFSLAYTTGHTLKGVTLFGSNHSVIRDKLALDTSLRLYGQSDNLGGKETIVTPTVKLAYQMKDRLSMETEMGLERTVNTPATGSAVITSRKYYSMGVRGDF